MNLVVIQCFGLADHTTLEYISKALGETTVLTRSTNAPSFEQATQQAATGESWSLSTQRLLTPEEISRFFSRDDKLLRQLILRPGYRPAILQRLFYDQDPLFQGRIKHVVANRVVNDIIWVAEVFVILVDSRFSIGEYKQSIFLGSQRYSDEQAFF